MATRKRAAKIVDDLRPEYDLSRLSGRVQGKYHEQAHAGTNLVLLEPEIAKAFPNSKTVNEALGLLLRVARTEHLRSHAHERSKPAKRSPRQRRAH
jgi:hypothetical protein